MKESGEHFSVCGVSAMTASGVKLRRTHCEQMSSGLAPSDIDERCWHFRDAITGSGTTTENLVGRLGLCAVRLTLWNIFDKVGFTPP